MDRELLDVEKLITESFTAHEHVAPDGDRVLAAARERIDRRRTVLSRPLAVAAGVVALTLVAVTVVALNRSGPTPTPADKVAAPATGPVSEPAIADLPMPFSLGWLPPGPVEYVVQRINIGATAADPDTPVYGGEYMLTVKTGGQVLQVTAWHMPGTLDDEAFKSGPGQPVTIGERRGVESSRSDGPGGYELYVEHPDSGVMYVGVSAQFGSTVPVQQLVDTGHRIAENIRYPGTTTVTPAFGLRELPSGMRICAFGVEGPSPRGSESSTSYSLGTCASTPHVHLTTGVPGDPDGTAGRPVQGHKTRYVNENGYHRLWVLDAVDGDPIHLAGSVPLADLYDIANRLVLPG